MNLDFNLSGFLEFDKDNRRNNIYPRVPSLSLPPFPSPTLPRKHARCFVLQTLCPECCTKQFTPGKRVISIYTAEPNDVPNKKTGRFETLRAGVTVYTGQETKRVNINLHFFLTHKNIIRLVELFLSIVLNLVMRNTRVL